MRIDRFSWIMSQLDPSDSVIHIGCCGDEWHFENTWQEGRSLHGMIEDQIGKERLFGVDLNRKRLQEMRAMGHQVFYGDAESMVLQGGEGLDLAVAETELRADAVVAGEVIEHLSNVGRFLAAVIRHLKPGGRLILTTPHAYGFWYQVCNWLGYDEERFVNVEHTHWHSRQTLAAVLQRHGWTVTRLDYLCPEPAARKLRWVKAIPELLPRLRPNLGAVAVRSDPQ